ncbi:hypothetical protein K2173_006492 [Erythroxylum novogranatense]|uniref:DNA polymerase epsilon catalytic subunit A C-terminal domain-containing protein n=1 Tax=Erythroxylum novogranatense TaxID=1862640 RepID=A0AAV8SKW3_9ROSI|nr:hypothetical protein K2173_006492 [Erythroxylum novogranatense]
MEVDPTGMADITLIVGFEDIGSGSNVIDKQYGFDEATSSARVNLVDGLVFILHVGVSEFLTLWATRSDPIYERIVHQPVLTYPGAYRKVFVELKIHDLTVNALLKSNQVNEMEGGSLLGFEDIGAGSNVIDEQYGFDDATSYARVNLVDGLVFILHVGVSEFLTLWYI